jgi:hypothetical protein
LSSGAPIVIKDARAAQPIADEPRGLGRIGFGEARRPAVAIERVYHELGQTGQVSGFRHPKRREICSTRATNANGDTDMIDMHEARTREHKIATRAMLALMLNLKQRGHTAAFNDMVVNNLGEDNVEDFADGLVNEIRAIDEYLAATKL